MFYRRVATADKWLLKHNLAVPHFYTLLAQPLSLNPMSDPFENEDIKHLQLFLYLLPVVGFFPALWTLYRRTGTRQQQNISRLAVTLAIGWLAGYILLGMGAETSPSGAMPLLLTSSLLTSGYFLLNLGLMIRLWQRKPLRLPIVSRLGDRLP